MRSLPVAIFLLCPLLHGVPWLLDSPVGMWISWLGLACGMWLATAPGPWSRLWCLWIWATVSIGIAFHWSADAMTYTLSSEYWLGCLVALPLILWDGLRLALGYWLGARCSSRPQLVWLSTAACTILLEEFMPSVFPWRLGMMQLPSPWWLQAVDVFGAGWSTLLAFAVAGLFHLGFETWRARQANVATVSKDDGAPQTVCPRCFFALAPCLLLVNAIYCGWSWQLWQNKISDAPSVRMGLVQVDPSHKVSIAQLQQLTRQIADGCQLVCWPESTGGTYDLRLESLDDVDRNFQYSRDPERGLRPWPNPRCELLLAGKNYQHSLLKPIKATVSESDEPSDEPAQLFVSAMLLDINERITGRYHKRYLMPFGEYVPGENVVPGMAELFDMCEHITPGHGSAVLRSDTGARIGVMLCYEDMVSRASANAVGQGANVIISLINGSAFSSRVTLHQHRLLAHMRALETRRTFVRCAATGETCVISACGQVTARLPLQENGTLTSDIPLLENVTVHSRSPYLLIVGMFCSLVLVSQVLVSPLGTRFRHFRF